MQRLLKPDLASTELNIFATTTIWISHHILSSPCITLYPLPSPCYLIMHPS